MVFFFAGLINSSSASCASTSVSATHAIGIPMNSSSFDNEQVVSTKMTNDNDLS